MPGWCALQAAVYSVERLVGGPMRSLMLAALAVVAFPVAAEELPPPPLPGEATPAASAAPPAPPPRDALALPAPPSAVAEPLPAPPPRARRFGLLFDAGLPEGASLALAFRPVPAIRLWAGPTWNYVAWGVGGGAALIPWHWAVSPSLSVEAGHFFSANLSRFLSGSGAPTEVLPLLRAVGYEYASVHLGVELGSQRGFAFSTQAGLSWIRVTAHGSSRTTQSGGSDVYFEDPRVTAAVPSVKVGFHYFFL